MVACRREKAVLLTEELPKLEKLVKKGKKLTPEIIEDRLQKACHCSSSMAAKLPCTADHLRKTVSARR